MADELTASVQRGDLARALALALKRWDKSRAPALGNLVEALGAQVPGAAPALTSVDVSKTSIRDMETLVAFCADLPPDPRIAGVMTRMLLRPPFTSLGSRGVWTPLLEQLADRHADPRTLHALEPVAADYMRIFGATNMGERMQRGVRGVIEALKERFEIVPADAEAQALLAGMTATPGPAPAVGAGKVGQGSGDELLAIVYEDPDDDAPRLVYADWLLERGDPRGEFIALQFRRHRGEALSPDDDRREHQLLKKHGKAWLGPLHAVTLANDNVFSRGFLERCVFTPRGAATALAVGHPSWATVRELSIYSSGSRDSGEELMAQPVMRRLRLLRYCNGSLLETLLAQPDLVLETLEYSWAQSRRDPGAAARAWPRLLAGEGLQGLRHLILGQETTLDPAGMEALLASPLAKRLNRLSQMTWGHRDALLAMLPRVPAPTEKLEVDLYHRVDQGVRVRRGPDGNMSATEIISGVHWPP